METRRFVIGISGASGIAYGVRTAEVLAAQGHALHLIVSKGAPRVAQVELGLDLEEKLSALSGDVVRHDVRDVAAAPASGSFRHDGMLVVPMSLRTGAAIANGLADDLITRSALVCLKEGRRLVLVPRETPLDLITLRNWVTLKEAGASLVPAMPGFYQGPQTVADMVDHVVGKALDQLDVPHELFRRWSGPPGGPSR